MANPVTISKSQPALQSMRYEELRSIGLERITTLSGTVWTDHNVHDPGITLLEALCYAITDIGYRLTFDIKDLLAADNDIDYKNFFTARQILHNAPLTVADYRKLLMDVAVQETAGETTEWLGVKNAWLEIATDAEVLIFANMLKSKLEHKQAYAGQPSFFVKGLYDVLLEFDNSEIYGDLNENTIEDTYTINLHAADENMEGVQFHITAGFKRWDSLSLDENKEPLIEGLESFTVFIEELPPSYTLAVNYNTATHAIEVDGERVLSTGIEMIPGLSDIELHLNQFVLTATDSLRARYKKKVQVVNRIVAAVSKKLNAHRNLCEDFYSVNALRIEEILLCADIEITATADTNKVAAAIYHDVAAFLSPEVYFYNLAEMQAKGYNSDEIFDGPALEHGFIDPAELSATERHKCIHVSDIIRIIMNVEVEGTRPVIAVRNLQIANRPQDNEDGSIDEKSVKWCLELAYDELYVPRLSEQQSKLTFYKRDLPFGYDEDDMFAQLDVLREKDRKRLLLSPTVDMPIPRGTWRETNDYVPVAEDLPLTYGVGSEGLKTKPILEEKNREREAQASQLKGFLLFFDQLLEGLLHQVTGVKELFSMSSETELGTSKLLLGNKTYYTAPPLQSLAGNEHLIADSVLINGLVQQAAEGKEDFEERKNRFLDHLLARFCEQFTDYALLAYSIDGARAGSELIKDKLEFLNNYPEISTNRGKAFDVKGDIVWNTQNTSGFEKRAALLAGVNKPQPAQLFFTPSKFVISGLNYYIRKTSAASNRCLKNISPFATRDALLENLESVVAAGCFRRNYLITPSPAHAGKFIFTLYADEEQQTPLAVGYEDDYTESEALNRINKAIEICRAEFINQSGANRKNLSPAIDAYFDIVDVKADMVPSPPEYSIEYKLYAKPFAFVAANLLLQGEIRGQAEAGDSETDVRDKGRAEAQKKLWHLLRYADDEDSYGFNPPIGPYTTDYRFVISDGRAIIGESKEKNFNQPLAAIIKNSPVSKLTIRYPDKTTAECTVQDADAQGPDIKINTNETLANTTPGGWLVFEETFTAHAAGTGKFVAPGVNLLNRITPGDTVQYKGTKPELDNTYTITAIELNGADTELYTEDSIAGSDTGTITTHWEFKIKKITPSFITIKAGWEQKAVKKFVQTLKTLLLEREGLHLLEHILLRPRYSTQNTPPAEFDDKLMSIHTDNECEECRIADVYSFIMSIVLPYWPERFRNMHLRSFVERTLRTEAPAHLAMNVCWVSPEHMYRFEQCYKSWLIEHNDTPLINDEANWKITYQKRGDALNGLIEILEQLRNVYPQGRLHSCDESGADALKGAIILNKTMLGSM